jgi:hypothetical protein
MEPVMITTAWPNLAAKSWKSFGLNVMTVLFALQGLLRLSVAPGLSPFGGSPTAAGQVSLYGVSTDLGLVVYAWAGLYLLAAVGLWRRRRWAWRLASTLLVSGMLLIAWATFGPHTVAGQSAVVASAPGLAYGFVLQALALGFLWSPAVRRGFTLPVKTADLASPA